VSHTCFCAAELSALAISTGAGAGGAGRCGGVYLDPPATSRPNSGKINISCQCQGKSFAGIKAELHQIYMHYK